jgi:methionine-rich copper-binding protein CopC
MEKFIGKFIERSMQKIVRILVASLFSLLISACASSGDYSPLLRAEPEINGELTRVPRTIRLFYDALPDVDQSSLKLIGPNGEHQLRGLHTMAADDLMIEIMDPVTTGEYRVEWTTVVGDNPTVYSGAFVFSVPGN